jgi:hypothetical protein
MKISTKTFGALLIGIAVQLAGAQTRAADTVFETGLPPFSITTYAGMGGGVSVPAEDFIPLMEASSGFQFASWIAVGGFVAANPLSSFEHADLGLAVADTEAAYALMSGTELLLTPWAENLVHPLVRVCLGGVSVGYLTDTDGEEGYDTSTEERFFFASVAAGAELNLTPHLRLGLRGGWRFAANTELMGIDEGELSGPEAALTLRLLWRTVFD